MGYAAINSVDCPGRNASVRRENRLVAVYKDADGDRPSIDPIDNGDTEILACVCMPAIAVDAGEDACETFHWAVQDARDGGVTEGRADEARRSASFFSPIRSPQSAFRNSPAPYGERTILHPTNWTPVAWANSYQNVLGFTGHKHDPETGLVYGNERYYHPTLGRWIGRDKIEYPNGMDLYEYVRSGPTNWLDPIGLQAKGGTKTYSSEMNLDKLNYRKAGKVIHYQHTTVAFLTARTTEVTWTGSQPFVCSSSGDATLGGGGASTATAINPKWLATGRLDSWSKPVNCGAGRKGITVVVRGRAEWIKDNAGEIEAADWIWDLGAVAGTAVVGNRAPGFSKGPTVGLVGVGYKGAWKWVSRKAYVSWTELGVKWARKFDICCECDKRTNTWSPYISSRSWLAVQWWGESKARSDRRQLDNAVEWGHGTYVARKYPYELHGAVFDERHWRRRMDDWEISSP